MSTSSARIVCDQLTALADAADALHLQRYFKTGPGEYGEGDVFIGVRVPKIRAVIKQHPDLALDEIRVLLESEVHEHRAAGLLVLVAQFDGVSRARCFDQGRRQEIADFYHRCVTDGRVNNWDLVDCSAGRIPGGWYFDRERTPVFDLCDSGDLWCRRVALPTTYGFIIRGDASTTLELAASVLDDRRDLTQKATGWMLREVGRRVDRGLLTGFLTSNAARMGRTALSYACEHLTPEERARFRAAGSVPPSQNSILR
ncbi:DNA alkylation repair protein [Rhodococcus sp. 27YEA15]|uniref:DNA alkylation repair protein n=1 Tax=Rhodococcus sp. 27YEA15 TaxID=3156259 RepID=UPI003C7B7623